MATPVKDVTLMALRLGVTAFGGPAAHIAMLRQEAVDRRKWLDDQRFLDLMGLTNLIPGPNSTELVMHVGRERGGQKGLWAAGAAFILPAALITLVFAWLYVEYGQTTQGEWILRGIKPVVLAVVVQAIWNLGKKALRTVPLVIIGVVVLALYLLGINELVLLVGGALAGLAIWAARTTFRAPGASGLVLPVLAPGAWLAQVGANAAVPSSYLRLFLGFLKIGAVLYGSGYVLLAFIEGEFVDRLGWLTEAQLLDAVAVGQFTPGPVFTTATFVGYVVGGFPGAIAATLGIFLPSFLFVAISHALLERLMGRPWIRPLLDGVNVAAIGLMAAVSLRLGQGALVDPLTVGLFLVAMALLLRWKVNSAVLVAGGALVSVVMEFVF